MQFLLKGFHEFNIVTPGDRLPKDPRTLLSTPKSNNVTNMESGSFCYYGLEKVLAQRLKYIKTHRQFLPEILRIDKY